MIVGVILIVALVAASYTMGLFRFRSPISNGNSPWPSLQANESVNGDTSSSGPSAPSSQLFFRFRTVKFRGYLIIWRQFAEHIPGCAIILFPIISAS